MDNKFSKQAVKGAKNIGPTIAKRLHEIDVYTLADLEEVGPAQAYCSVQANYPGKTLPVCYYLYSLEDALTDTHWNDIPAERKEQLLKEVVK